MAATLTVNNAVTSPATSRSPNITVAGTITNSGAYHAGSGTTSVAGYFTNSGTFAAGTGTVVFNGTLAQPIGGTSSTTFQQPDRRQYRHGQHGFVVELGERATSA